MNEELNRQKSLTSNLNLNKNKLIEENSGILNDLDLGKTNFIQEIQQLNDDN